MLIYKITNLLNNKIYVGKRQRNKKEFLESNYYGSGLIIREAIKKYGVENFKREILEDNIDTKELLNEREKFWIKNINSLSPNGYNIKEGGEGGDSFTNNPNKEKIRINQIIRLNRPDTKRKMIENHANVSGKNNPMYGIKHSQKSRDKISKTRLEKECSKGKNNGMYGKKHSKLTLIKISNNTRLAMNKFEIKKKQIENSPSRTGKNNGMYGKKQPTEKCIYCNKEYSKTNIKRFHNENCKYKIRVSNVRKYFFK